MLGEVLGFFEGLVARGFAFGAQGAEFDHIAFDSAVDALLIESEELEIVGFGDPGAGLVDGFVDGELVGVFPGMVRSVDLASGEDAGFDGADTLEAPAIFGDGLGEIDFKGADGSEGGDDAIAVGVEGFLFGFGEDESLAGESVTVGIETRAMRGFGVWGLWLEGIANSGVGNEGSVGRHSGLPFGAQAHLLESEPRHLTYS